MSGPNLATATGTRIDSAAKHQIAVRASYEHLLSWVGYEQIVLQKEKHAFAIAKDELAIACTRSVRKNVPSRGNQRNKAYPSVVTTLARMEQAAKNYLIMLLHNHMTFAERDTFINHIEKRPDAWDPTMSEIAKKQISEMPEFFIVGVSVGMAYAHHLSGDNVCTVMAGGMKTVMNGAFEIDTGDMLQWYWSAEESCFDKDGKRHDPITDRRSQGVAAWMAANEKTGSQDSMKRKAFYQREQGVFVGSQTDGNTNYNAKKELAYPKSLRPAKDGSYRLSDKMRIFGRAMSGARPFEPFDVMISRQSM